MKDLYLDCFSGIAGDMLVGALLDLGAPFETVCEGLARLPVTGYRLERRTVRRHAIAATKFEVILEGHGPGDPGTVDHSHRHAHARDGSPEHGHVHDPHGHEHDHAHGHDHPDEHAHEHRHEHRHEHGPSRGLREIRSILDAADLPSRARSRALAAFALLAEAEARVHGTTPDEVHFHEVGAVDAICDIVGASLALEALGVDRVYTGPVRAGSGFVRCEHGTMPVPAPGTLGCLEGFDVRFEDGRGELVTPTGACLLGALAIPRVPDGFVVARTGYGAGTRDPADRPNVVRAVLGSARDEPPCGADEVVELATNLDHLPPTQIAVAVDAAFAAGAVEAFTVPCTMKKGRPGHLLVALAPPDARERVEAAIFRETGTLGIRRRTLGRSVLARRTETVATPWGDVPVKVGTYGGVATSAVPEFEDCRRLAEAAGVPVAAVLDAARRACEKVPR